MKKPGEQIYFKVKDMQYNFGTASNEPCIVLQLDGFQFGEDNQSLVLSSSSGGIHTLWLYLNKSTFSALTDHYWDGTSKDVERIKKIMLNKEFSLKLDMTSKSEISKESPAVQAVS
ncbi:MAG: hypothetical protein HY446_00600 [Candidatus Niyogibacteria bacterium]|nr:hypothetical protein [Candidatus Niyogibacteria bacterium]